MNKNTHIETLAQLAASQNGLFSTAQANAYGVPRDAVARLARLGRITRMAQGVYHLNGVPSNIYDDLRAAWLSTAPEIMLYNRLAQHDDIVIGGRTAAAIHGIGEFFLSPYRFYTSKRFNSRNSEISCSIRHIPTNETTVIDGLRVTTVERTLYDLALDNEDPSLLANTIRETVESRQGLNYSELERIIDTHRNEGKGHRRLTINQLFESASIQVISLGAKHSAQIVPTDAHASGAIVVNAQGECVQLTQILPYVAEANEIYRHAL